MDLISADWHLNDNPRDAYRLKFIGRLIDIIRTRPIKRLVILGDITEQKDRHGAWLVNQVVDSIARLTQEVSVIVLKGNHDYLESDEPFFGFLSNVRGKVEFITNPTRIGVTLFLPHTRDHKRDWTGLDFNADLIYTHNTFQGARGSNNHTLNGIPLSAIPKHIPIVSGDVHIPQHFENLTYVGAPYTIDFGDEYEPRVLMDAGDHKFKGIRLSGPRKRVINVALVKALSNVSVNKGDIVRVQLKVQAGQYSKWAEIVAEVRAWGEQNEVLVDSVIPIVATAKLGEIKTRTYAPMTDEQLLKAYAKQNDIDERTLKIGLELLK